MTQSDLRFGPLTAPARFEGADDIARLVGQRLKGWTIAPWDGPSVPPIITVGREGNLFVLSSPWAPEPETYRTATSIVCAFISDLTMAFAAHRDDLVFLHAGAVSFDGRLIVFPSRTEAGKSTLTVVAAAHGAQIFSDDVLPYDLQSGRAMGLGVSPRPRLPFPADLKPSTLAYLNARVALANKHYASMEFDAGALAPFGTSAPVECVVTLARGDGKPGLFPASRAATMKLLMIQRFGAEPSPAALVRATDRLTASVPCLTLRYRNADDGAALLARAARDGFGMDRKAAAS